MVGVVVFKKVTMPNAMNVHLINTPNRLRNISYQKYVKGNIISKVGLWSSSLRGSTELHNQMWPGLAVLNSIYYTRKAILCLASFLTFIILVTLYTVFRRRQWHPTPVLFPGKFHGWKSLVGCSLWGRSESDTTERLHFHFSLSCTGEGNGNPLQCSCLENPRDRGAWWAAVSGVTQSQTQLKQLSSSSILFIQSHILTKFGKISIIHPSLQMGNLRIRENKFFQNF